MPPDEDDVPYACSPSPEVSSFARRAACRSVENTPSTRVTADMVFTPVPARCTPPAGSRSQSTSMSVTACVFGSVAAGAMLATFIVETSPTSIRFRDDAA